MYKTRFELLFSFIFFALMVAIGIVTSVHEPDFASNILGDSYVQMTIENIENKDPMAVYKSHNGMDMFLGITLNNIKVAFYTFLLGFFFGLGTFFILLQNGIMLGTFQYFFIERDLFKESFLTIWQHGTLEISAIIIAGAAGFTIGRGLILPGTYTRFQSLRLTARRGIKIMIGLIPVFMMAGFIEGFFTRYTEVPDYMRLISIILSLSFVLFYFVFYPRLVARHNPEKIEIADKLNESGSELPKFNKILSFELLFGGTLRLIKEHFLKIVKFILIASTTAGIIIALKPDIFFPEINDNLSYGVKIFREFISFNNLNLLYIKVPFFSILFLFSSYLIKLSINTQTSSGKFIFSQPFNIFNAVFIFFAIQSPFLLGYGWGIFISIFFVPFALLLFYSCVENKVNIIKGIGITFRLLNKNLGKFILHNLVFVALSILLFMLANPFFYEKILSLIQWNLWLENYYVNFIFNLILSFIFFTIIAFAFMVLTTANNLLYHTLYEINTCECLISSVQKIGVKNKIRGYEIE